MKYPVFLLILLCVIPTSVQADNVPAAFFDVLADFGTSTPTPGPTIDMRAPTMVPTNTPTPVPPHPLENLAPAIPFTDLFPKPTKGTLMVVMLDFRNDKGDVRVLLCNSAEGFPYKIKKIFKKKLNKIEKKSATVVFDNLPFDTYAISVFHDEDGDTKIKTNWLGKPKEGVGTSNDAKPPKYQNAVFEMNSEQQNITIHMTYL